VNRRFGEKYRHLLTLVPHSLIFFTLEMETILSSETSVHTRSTQRHIPEDAVLYFYGLFNDAVVIPHYKVE
jgi:hypothetical protein